MELIILAVLVLVVTGVGVGLLHHLGWEERLKTVAEIFSSGMHAVTQRVSQAYFESFLPAVRRTKAVTIGMVGLLAVLAWFISLPVRASLGLTALAAVICAFVAFLDRQGRMENGDLEVETGRVVRGVSVITAGNHEVRAVYPPFVEETDIEVMPYDPSMKLFDPASARLATPPAVMGPGEYVLESQGPAGFTIRLHANAASDVHFRWRVSLHASETDQAFGQDFGERPILSVTPFDRTAGYDIPQLRPDGFVTRISPAPVADSHFTWRAAERPEGNPALRIVTTAYTVFAVMGVALFAAGIACNSRPAVMLSIVPVAMSIAIFFALARFFVWVAEKTAGMAEFGPNIGIQFLIMALKRDFSRAEQVLKDAMDSRTQAVNLVDQEQFRKEWKHTLLKIVAALSSIYGIAILIPYGSVLSVWTLCLLLGWFWTHQYECQINRLKLDEEKALCEADDAKKRGASATFHEGIAKVHGVERARLICKLSRLRIAGLTAFITLTSVILVFVIVMLVVPGGEAMVNTFIKDAVGVVSGFFSGTHKGFGWIAGKSIASYTPALFAAILAGLAAGAVKGTGKSKVRNWASIPLDILCIAAFVAFGAGVLSAAMTVARDEMEDTGRIFAWAVDDLKAEVVDGKPELSWNVTRVVNGFTLERRKATDTAFVSVSELASGTTAWRDTTAADGETYFYRLVIKPKNGSSVFSKEVRVSVSSETKTVDGLKAEVVDGKPELSWSAIQGAVEFKVQRRLATEAASVSVSNLAAGLTAWRDKGAEEGETYFYRLVIKTRKGEVSSNEVKVSVPKTACTGLACGRNVALAQYCAENPGACP